MGGAFISLISRSRNHAMKMTKTMPATLKKTQKMVRKHGESRG